VLHDLLQRTEASYPDRAHLLWEVWEDAVGEELGKRSYPVELRRGRLTVAVSSAPWMQQLSFMREQLRDALNRAVGQDVVREVRFRVAVVEPPRPARRLAPPPEWLGEALPEDALTLIDEEISSVADAALRQSIRDVRVRAEQIRRFRDGREAAEPPPSTSSGRRAKRGERGS
jgi:hypothetical protein